MRPPSYYNSIVRTNNSTTGHSYASSDYDSTPRTSSQQLRSSFSSPSSSSYVSRSHLPFVPQSTLVAHCFTGVGSSTRPYGSATGSSSASYRSSGSSYISPTSTLASSAGSYSTNSSSSSSLSSRPPTTKRAYASSATNYSSSLSRPSYLSPSSTATSRYRPTPTTLSSYYKPIRLRERPLLTQISRQIGSPTPPPPPPATTSRADPEATHSKSSGETKAAEDEQAADWSQDIGRNISRNKYLIKFREIDKQSSSKASADIEATISLPASLPDQRQKEPQEQEREIESVTVKLPVEASKEPLAERGDHTKSEPIEGKKRDTKEPAGEMRLVSEEETVKRAPVAKKEKKNVKLRLRQVGGATAAKKTADAEATTTTTIIDKKPAEKAPTDQQVKAEVAPNEPNTKPAKTKRLVARSKDEKENRTEAVKKEAKSSSRAEATDAALAAPAKVKTKKKAKKESEEQAPAAKSATSKAPTNKADSIPVQRQPGPEVPASGGASPKKTLGRIRFREYNHNDFNFLTVLGHGGWGFVILAELKEHDACFAVKCIKKITIVEDDDYDSIMIERKVLALGNIHPFICKLFCTFETPGYLFFVMEYCAGGDLMFHVQHEGKFSESRCRFYAAEIICAIRFLHNRHIIYRDLKLDNILLDARGHIRLVDFGMCQCRTYREEMLPSNFCGTPEYISPEIIKGVPYNHSVDWWSFGVLLYEMAVGKMPFRGNDENELLWNVCYEQIHYPMFLTKELTSLLKSLLEREPSLRMGMATCKAGDIYDQAYFRGVDWKAVEEMRVEPPFVPEVRSNRDVSNFDSDFTESTCELSPVPESTLAKIDQKQFQQFPYTNPDVFIFDTPRAP